MNCRFMWEEAQRPRIRNHAWCGGGWDGGAEREKKGGREKKHCPFSTCLQQSRREEGPNK